MRRLEELIGVVFDGLLSAGSRLSAERNICKSCFSPRQQESFPFFELVDILKWSRFIVD